MPGPSEPHFVVVLPPDLDGLADVVGAVIAQSLLAGDFGDGFFAGFQTGGDVDAVAEEDGPCDGG